MAGRKPGSPKTGGRKKGTPNKLSGDVRAMVLAALDEAGGTKYLLEQAASNPSAFMTLVGKVLPKEVTGANGKDLFPTSIQIVGVEAK